VEFRGFQSRDIWVIRDLRVYKEYRVFKEKEDPQGLSLLYQVQLVLQDQVVEEAMDPQVQLDPQGLPLLYQVQPVLLVLQDRVVEVTDLWVQPDQLDYLNRFC
jgi:hypothetical protein